MVKIEKIKALFQDKNNRMKGMIAIGLIGIFCIMLSEYIPSKGSAETKTAGSQSDAEQARSVTDYQEQTEHDLEEIISKIEGVGQCSAMVTFESSAENVYAYNSSSEFGEKNEKREYDYIIVDRDNGEQPIIVKEIQPKIKGVIIVCEGGDNSKVKAAVIDSVTSAFSIASNKISIHKMGNDKER